MAIITRDEVKTYLNITDSSQDAVIDLMIPVVDSTVRDYTNFNYKTRFRATVTNGSNEVLLEPAVYADTSTSIDTNDNYKYPGYKLSKDWLQIGKKLQGTGITEGTYITDIDDDASTVTLSANATADFDGLIYATSTIGESFIFAKMVQELINSNNTRVNAGGEQSITEGPTSVTYKAGATDKINGISKSLFEGLKRYA